MASILFVDNDPDFLATRCEYLENEGYHVIRATNPVDAQDTLEANNIELVILDIRLLDDDDAEDISGIILAKEMPLVVPKIILTGFPSADYVRQALAPQLERLSAAVDFVAKQEGSEAMLQVVRRVLKSVNNQSETIG